MVDGKKKGAAVLLTFAERKTRKELVRKLKDRTQTSVIRVLNGVERRMGTEAFRVIFKFITAENLVELFGLDPGEDKTFFVQTNAKVCYI